MGVDCLVQVPPGIASDTATGDWDCPLYTARMYRLRAAVCRLLCAHVHYARVRTRIDGLIVRQPRVLAEWTEGLRSSGCVSPDNARATERKK